MYRDFKISPYGRNDTKNGPPELRPSLLTMGKKKMPDWETSLLSKAIADKKKLRTDSRGKCNGIFVEL
jgi:hypothetical protein